MSNLIPYERYGGGNRLYLTGKCKRKIISYKDGSYFTVEYVQCRVRILGIPLWTHWVDKDCIVYREVKEEIYDCDIT
jgi:hypothetical protein